MAWRTRSIGLIAFALIGMLPGYTHADDNKVSTGDDKTDAAMVSVQKKLKDIQSCTAQLSTVFKLMGQEAADEADAAFQAPDRMRLTATKDGRSVPVMVVDGGLMWTYDPDEQVVTKFNRVRIYRETKQEVDAYVPDPLRPFRGLKWTSIRYVGDDTTHQKTRYVFEAVPEPNLLSAQLPVAPVKLRMTIQAADGLLRSVSLYDEKGVEIVARQFAQVKVNPKLAADLFEFVIPAGAQVMDATDETMSLLKPAGGP